MRWIAAGVAVALGLAAAGGTVAARAAAPAEAGAPVAAAIEQVVRARFGDAVEIALDSLQVRADLTDARGLVALIDPSARLGLPTRVGLKVLRGRGKGVRIGEATCVIRVRAPFYEVIAPIARGTMVDAPAVRLTEGWLDGLPIRPVADHVVHLRAQRDLAPGDIVLGKDIAVPPAVRSGEAVIVRLASGPVSVTAEAVAAQDGQAGDEIRVVNPSSGRVFRGRVVGPGEIEVTHGS